MKVFHLFESKASDVVAVKSAVADELNLRFSKDGKQWVAQRAAAGSKFLGEVDRELQSLVHGRAPRAMRGFAVAEGNREYSRWTTESGVNIMAFADGKVIVAHDADMAGLHESMMSKNKAPFASEAAKHKLCDAVEKLVKKDYGHDDGGDMCWSMIESGDIDGKHTPEQAAQMVAQRLEQA